MNIISCNSCGLVYDINKIPFPSEDKIYDISCEGGSLDGIAEWNGDKFIPVIKCLCGEYIQKEV